MKFSECKELDQINHLKEELYQLIEQMMIDPTDLQKELSEQDFKTTKEFVPSLLAKDCGCGSCLAMDKLEVRMPAQLEPLFAIARKRCQERNY